MTSPLKSLPSLAYARKITILRLKLSIVELHLAWTSWKLRRPTKPTQVLDAIRATEANERRVDILQTRQCDLLNAISLLEHSTTIFFQI
jgi:hypothetical protein